MKNDKHPLAVNIIKYQRYNFAFLNCQEIVLFETLLVLGGISFKNKEFFHSTQTLSDKTGIKKHSINKILSRFKGLGFIEYQIKGMPKVKHITVLWENIFEQLPDFYQPNENDKQYDDIIKLFIEYFQPLTDTNKEKNINKNIKEEYKKENNVIALEEFSQYLNKFFEGRETVRSQFEENDFYEALEIYSYDEIIDAIPYDMNNYYNNRRDMRTFFNRNDQGKIEFIEKRICDRKQEKESILNRFKEIMESRIKMYNENNAPQYKSLTSLPIYNSSLKKIKRVFEIKKKEDVFYAFTAFCDDFLNGTKKINHDVLGYFLKEDNGVFPIVNDYQILYLGNYIGTNNYKDYGCGYDQDCSCY